MNQNNISYLLTQYAAGKLTPEELQELGTIFSTTNREELEQQVAGLMQQHTQPQHPIATETANTTFLKIIAADKRPASTIQLTWWKVRNRWLGAAALIILSSSAFIYFMTGRRKTKLPVAISQPQLIKPEKSAGRNTAILTLADNSVVELDSLNNGLVTTQGGSQVMMADGQLNYVSGKNGNASAVTYNKVTTPRGGEYSITLSDGTQVWLNAASSLKFPTVFSGNKRAVELSGEAYLAVAEDNNHPFEVKIGNVNVAVHGTQFNVMGYEDETHIVTTLVSGAVSITTPGNEIQMLEPGEHAVINDNGNLYIEKADVEEETAWKNGKTYFNGVNIKNIMRQIARWYDVDVEYKGNVSNMDFTCTVSRTDKLSKLLNLMEMTGAVHFTMQGNTIIVQP